MPPGSRESVDTGRWGSNMDDEDRLLLLRTTGGTGAAGLLAGGCQGDDRTAAWVEVEDGRLPPSRIPLIPIESGGKLLGESV
jgi:hypothetical protein